MLDWATSVTFENEQSCTAGWTAQGRSRLLGARPPRPDFRAAVADLILTDGGRPATGVGIFRHTVTPGQDDQFVDAAGSSWSSSAPRSRVSRAPRCSDPTGVRGMVSILRFRTDHQLQAWMNSTERRGALPELRSQLAEDFTVITRSTPFGSILRVQDGATRVTPKWKTAMLVLLVLYPTVMTLSRFLGPALDKVGARNRGCRCGSARSSAWG